jgi:RNA polymerase sigma-70 factor (ECF subfamily)
MARAPADAQPTDAVLAAAARAGDAPAFPRLAERHYPPVLRYLLRQTGDPELAADLAQETFLDAWRDLDRLTGDQPFAPWLFRIALHNLLAAWRWRRLHRLVSLDWLLTRNAPALPALRQPDASAACCECALIEQVLAELSLPLREALVLHTVEGFTGREVAAILGIPPATARQRIARAKEHVRVRYEAVNGASDDPGL